MRTLEWDFQHWVKGNKPRICVISDPFRGVWKSTAADTDTNFLWEILHKSCSEEQLNCWSLALLKSLMLCLLGCFPAGCWNPKAGRIPSLHWFWNESRWPSSDSVDLWESFGWELPCPRPLGTLQPVLGKEINPWMFADLFSCLYFCWFLLNLRCW